MLNLVYGTGYGKSIFAGKLTDYITCFAINQFDH